jgi:hypothetical protein
MDTTTSTTIEEYINDGYNYDLRNPIYRAGYRYALQQVELSLDELKNTGFTISCSQEKDKLKL